MVSHAVATYGALHYAVNNAGIGGGRAPAGEVDLADRQRVIGINVNGVPLWDAVSDPGHVEGGCTRLRDR